jgi:hypothetical protein
MFAAIIAFLLVFTFVSPAFAAPGGSSFSGTAANVINNGYTLYVNGTALSDTSDSDDGGDDSDNNETASLTFSESGITETVAGSGYTIDGTALTITAAGTYRVSGSCSDGSIVVNKSLNDVTLILDDLTLASSSTAPIVIKKSSTVNIHLEGLSAITDNEDPDDETSSDATVADAFEGAAIKVKSGSTVTFCGDGNLNIVANAKNGIKGGSTAALIFNGSGTVTVTGSGKYYGGTKSGAAVNNGIACDGSIVFNQGTFVIKATGDGIKSAPDATDATEGTTIDTDSEGAVTINGGTFDIDVDGDGIQADTALTINGGTFDIQTWKGYSVWNDTLADSNSCKGLKASGDRAEEAGYDPTLTITGGTFTLNTGDDAVHSDAYVTVTGGTFTISTGDDGMHADTSLILGTENGLERDPDVTINSSYEGLEGGTVYIYSGRYYVIASDDGVNAAGGSSNGSDTGGGGGNIFNPGGGRPGGNQGRPGGGSSSSSDYNIYIYGGDLYVNCNGDGLDSNGGLYLYGGTQAVFSMRSGGDNSAIDADGTILIQGASVFTAGAAGMDGSARSSWFGSNQKYAANSSSRSAGTVLDTMAGSSGSVIFSYELPKAVNYVMASWPSSVSGNTPTITTAGSVTSCKGGSWSHSWNSGVITTEATSTSTGVLTYTCTSCGATEKQTIPMTVIIDECDHSAEDTTADEGFTVTYAGDAGVASITVYETQDYTGASESVSATGTTVSRDSDSGDPDSTGNGQVNFTVVLNDGYALSAVTAASGTYKNIKGPSDTGLANTYRITKITSDTTITITTVECEHGTVADDTTPSWIWSDDFGTATLSYICADCESAVDVTGTVTSELTDASTITFTATIGDTSYSDTKTASPFTVTFVLSDGVTVDVYYTQDTSAADESAVTRGVARDSDSGCPVITGDGQINFTIGVADDYTFDGLTTGSISGSYKNLKDVSTTDLPYTYRITKIAGNITVVVTATAKTVEGDHIHSLTEFSKTDETCETDGNISCWYCAECGKYFSDANGENEINASDTVIPATGHIYGEAVNENVVAATCESNGSYDEVIYCSVCDAELSRVQKTVNALGHDYVETVVPPTETEGGYTLHECSRCGDSYKDSFTDPVGSEPHDLKGDVDFDGDVDNADLILIARHLVNIITLNERQLKVADMNDDGTVNNADLILHARFLVGIYGN